MIAVKMRGLPFKVTDEEILDFYKDFKIKKESLIYGKDSQGRKNGMASICFESEEEADRADEKLNK